MSDLKIDRTMLKYYTFYHRPFCLSVRYILKGFPNIVRFMHHHVVGHEIMRIVKIFSFYNFLILHT
jgi:hypothetical protein